MIRHLKSAGVPTADILAVNCSTIRPVIEYACPAYHPMMNISNTDDLERMQARILKIIYGYNTSYRKAMEMSGLPTLHDRRVEIESKFTLKNAGNPRFISWFPTHFPYNYELRKKKTYEEVKSNTNNLYRSPIYSMRRYSNEML